MTRTLVLLRHATAGSPPGVPDVDRPLTDAGHAEARDVGRRLPEVATTPALVLCSTARRARDTAAGLALAEEVSVWHERDLYLAAAGTMLERIQQVEDEVGVLLVVAHNPGLHQLVLDLAGADMAQVPRFSPASLAVLELAGPWEALRPGDASLTRVHHAT